MSNREDLLTPVGRLVQGSLYKGQTKDAEGNPLVYKTGNKAGQPRVNFFFALAIPKGTERHWSETKWGKLIWDVGHKGFPNGQADSPHFAWKIVDGDSTMPNKVGNKPCENIGFAGNWVLNFSSSGAPAVYAEKGTKQVLEENYIRPGDYIEVFGNVSDNEALQQPGIYLNHQMVCFAGYGERISFAPDAKDVGFGQSALPPGVSPVPLGTGFNPTPVTMPAAMQATYTAPPASISAPPPIVPHHGILTPPPPLATPPAKVMTPKANGVPYEAYIAQGWNDQQLIKHGYMQA